MKKSISIFLVILLSVLGFHSVGYCAAMVELIDNLGVAKIVSMEVRPLYTITDETLAWLRAEKVPEQIVTTPNLLKLKDQTYDGRETFVSALEQALDKATLGNEIEGDTLQTLILRYAKHRPSDRTPALLDVHIDIINTNERDVKLTECTFEFFLHDKEAPGELITLGTDRVYQNEEIYLPSNPKKEAGKIARVKFSVELKGEQNTSFDPTVHLLNFIGKPADDDYLFVKGRFNLGLKSEKGWTFGEAVKVEWMFCPQMQNKLPLHECFVELPPPAPDFPGSITSPLPIACDKLVKAGRNIVIPRTDYYIADLGQSSGTVRIDFQTYTEPDRIVIEYEGNVVFDTGCVGSGGTNSLAYSGDSTTMRVTVHSRCDFVGPAVTDWDFRLSCPQ